MWCLGDVELVGTVFGGNVVILWGFDIVEILVKMLRF